MKRLILPFLLLFSLAAIQSNAQCTGGQSTIRIAIVPDSYPQESHWTLRDFATGALIDSGDANSDTVCVPAGQCISFTMLDDYGDGMCCAYGNGSYQVFVNGILRASGGDFNSSETTYINCPPGISCSDPLTAGRGSFRADFPNTYYRFIPDSTGQWQFSTCNQGNSCDPILYIYDHCSGLVPAENNQGTAFYNDDACNGNQSQITASMMAGDTFYIRVGDYQTSCSNDSINWNIQFLGPISGCTDPNSCNYNPLATISDNSCIYPPSPLCPSPDLMVVQSAIETSMSMDDLNVNANNCYVDEGCLNGYGQRRILRFTTHIKNIGDEDYYIGVPGANNPQFIWGGCHNHWHYEGYANYRLFDVQQQELQVGFKNGFCVLDLECSGGGTAKYGCGNMGITAGCGDIYGSGLDCQWIDVTDVDTGTYTLVVTVNWDRSPDNLGHYEKRYDNNWAQVCFNLSYDASMNKVFTLLPTCPPIVDCAGDTFGNAALDCAGVCGGISRTGDLNADTLVNNADVSTYVSQIMSGVQNVSNCTDLNGDGSITLTDAARLNACLRHNQGNHTHPSGSANSHNHCEFPYNVSNPFDTMTFAIADTNLKRHYIDLSIYNPIGRMLGVELKIHGLSVDSVKNIALGNYRPEVYSARDGKVVVMARDENSLFRQVAPLNFLRVYFDTLTDTLICIEQVVVALNDNYEEAHAVIGGDCFKVLPGDTSSPPNSVTELSREKGIQIYPNPSDGKFEVYLTGLSMENAICRIHDLQGKLIWERKEQGNWSNHTHIELDRFDTGLYLFSVESGSNYLSRRLLLEKKAE